MNQLKTRQEYRFRAECYVDIQRLSEQLDSDSPIQVKRIEGYPDVKASLLTSLTLEEVRDFMRKVSDGHVMLQTVSHSSEYTGERNYDLN